MFQSNIDAKRFETLIEINTLINSDFGDITTLLTTILDSATRLTKGEASSLLLVNQENNKLYFEIALGTKGPAVKNFSINMGEGIAGWVAQNNRSLIVNDADDDARHLKQIGKQIGYKTDTILAVPMRIKDRCVGVIEIINKEGGKNFDQEDLQWLEIFANQAAIAIQNAKDFQKMREEVSALKQEIKTEEGYHTLVYESEAIGQLLNVVGKVARTNSPVLIQGESGVGKELFAEAVHLSSLRSEEPFIRVNCAALPDELLESELFGHVKGAFTDASSDRRGRFELADGGTIFLDEIGDFPLNLQAKLLRVIESMTFEKVGSSETQKVNVRIIAATNKNLEEARLDGRFRDDLFFRLNVIPLMIPPLRDRTRDIPVLCQFFLKQFNRSMNKSIIGFQSDAMDELISYQWPGNVRELENVVERAVVICQDKYISGKDLMLGNRNPLETEAYGGKTLKDAVTVFKRHFIEQTLGRCEGKQTETAKALGIQRTYLSRLIKELDIFR